MMRAIVRTASVEIECPKCKETVPEPTTGSLFWTVGELPITGEVECPCGQLLKIKAPSSY